ncbi:MAG: hypothetical protein JM58_16745 [Peptococcaceae bacterium BICA1-8]|nr:MAG: hypothetical protein JM58_16745 [Peptococcaceae bacterium BICA1-8]
MGSQKFLTTRRLNILSILVLASVLIVAIYIMRNNIGLIEGLDFGPGQYYYTDLPGWEEIFFGEKSITLGTKQPFLFFGLFFLWGYACFKFISWMESKK